MSNCDRHCCCRQETDDEDDNESTVTEPIVKPQKASLDTMDILKLAGGIYGRVLVKGCVVYKKWINE